MWTEIDKEQILQWLRNWREVNEMQEKLRRDQVYKDLQEGTISVLTGNELVGPLELEKLDNQRTAN